MVAGAVSVELHSSSWYRVSQLQLRLKAHVRVVRHEYRGELWLVVEDVAAQKSFRFNGVAWQLLGLLDGTRTVQSVWEQVLAKLGDDAPTQDETIQLLGQLHAADLLASSLPPDVNELISRSAKQRQQKWWQRLQSPMSIKLPLIDPDAFLRATLPAYRWLFSVWGMVLWSALIIMGGSAAVTHWPSLTENLSDRVLAPVNLLAMALIFPVLKALHEFGHACAVRARNGEVHEMGVMLLVFFPVPYVDASASSAFRDKSHRIVVGAGGMMIELAIAALAMLLWTVVEPGVVRSMLFNIMLIAGVTTVLFNANPLLKFDGYYMLADWLEIPNFGQRAQSYIAYVAERYILGNRDKPAPLARGSEKVWLALYAVTSFFYRLLVTLGIALFVASQYFFIGVVLALWSLFTALVLPCFKTIRHLFKSSYVRRSSARAWGGAGVVALGLLLIGFVAPMPSRTHVEGVLWVSDQSVLRAGSEGFITKLLVEPGTDVVAGTPLLELEDPVLEPQERMLSAKLRELEFKRRALAIDDRVQAQITDEEIRYTTSELARVRERLSGLRVVSAVAGTFVLANPADATARFVKQGEQLGFVVPRSERIVRVVVSQEDIDTVRTRTQNVDVRLAEALGEVTRATILREVPAASGELPSAALTPEGGGKIARDPKITERVVALTPVFHFDLRLPANEAPTRIGSRVHVRFNHGAQPLAQQAWRSVRQLFLKRLNV